MKQVQLEWLIGGAALAALTGSVLAAYKYKNHLHDYERDFDPQTVEELDGKVEDVMYSGPENSDEMGMELLVQAGDELIQVHLGPVWYVEKQGREFKPGDKITVRGAKAMFHHEPVLIAEHIVRSKRMMKLRDEQGHPLWEAWLKVN